MLTGGSETIEMQIVSAYDVHSNEGSLSSSGVDSCGTRDVFFHLCSIPTEIVKTPCHYYCLTIEDPFGSHER